MIPLRQIYDDAPAFIRVPEALRHQRIEVTLWPLGTGGESCVFESVALTMPMARVFEDA